MHMGGVGLEGRTGDARGDARGGVDELRSSRLVAVLGVPAHGACVRHGGGWSCSFAGR